MVVGTVMPDGPPGTGQTALTKLSAFGRNLAERVSSILASVTNRLRSPSPSENTLIWLSITIIRSPAFACVP